MAYKPKGFSVEALGYYDGLYGRPRGLECAPESKRWDYNWGYALGRAAAD